jgi:hypothetical protein
VDDAGVGPAGQSRALDPADEVLASAARLGGSGTLGDWGTSVALDASGNVYIAGDASSNDFPTAAGAYQRSCASGGSGSFVVGDAFVAKFNPSLSGSASLVYSTYLGSGDGCVSDMVDNNHRLNAVVFRRTQADACDAHGDPLFARRQVRTPTFHLTDPERRFCPAYSTRAAALSKPGPPGRAATGARGC